MHRSLFYSPGCGNGRVKVWGGRRATSGPCSRGCCWRPRATRGMLRQTRWSDDAHSLGLTRTRKKATTTTTSTTTITTTWDNNNKNGWGVRDASVMQWMHSQSLLMPAHARTRLAAGERLGCEYLPLLSHLHNPCFNYILYAHTLAIPHLPRQHLSLALSLALPRSKVTI